MANAQIVLFAKARKLGIENYRRMNEAELKTAIASAQKAGSAPAKGKAASESANGKAETAKVPAKGKAAPAKGAAKGKAAPVKKAPAKTATKTKTAPAKSTRKAAPPKGAAKAAKGAQVKRPSRGKVVEGTRQPLGKIKWNVPSNVGTTGKRKEVLDSLREHKGDKALVFKALKRKAVKFYPTKEQHAAERMLVWLIGRVAFDYAYKTGQHTPAERAAYGTSDRVQDVRRREAREAARKPVRARKTTAARKAAPAKGKGRKTATARRGRR